MPNTRTTLNTKTKLVASLPMLILAWICLFFAPACQKAPTYGYIQGQTMGTSYHIRYKIPQDAQGNPIDAQTIQTKIDQRLLQINQSMSTYQDDSTISQFNQSPANTPITLDADFSKVLADSKTIYQQSGGAFNPTVLPLVEAWGFGSKMTVEHLQNPPSQDTIAHAQTLVDFSAIIQNGNQIHKQKDGISLDFSAIAKGYGVDAIATLLKQEYQIQNYMVEIGGEIATLGKNDKNKAWQIAIDAPILNSQTQQRQTLTTIKQPNEQNGMHLATSGNYRNTISFNGKKYSHSINPNTGHPVENGAASVTVLAETVAIADAWATALTAIPADQALQLANQNQIAALFITEDENTQNTWKLTQTQKLQALQNTP